ncbi:hypothetical protein Ahy_B03g064083 [Arachis hypogaea]|uniref:Uncharacterized protein n=1 Tax=Arachis hypogaea TaxID=3818 RepID=A0A444ZYL6_ARAHY|nr:hypothetical protein Ahy_B03g064083 [Arachis hypogaea]
MLKSKLRVKRNGSSQHACVYRKLIAEPTEEEIKNALYSIGSFKVPGSDGFPSLIYKNNWDLMKGKLFVWEWTSTNGEWDLEKLRLHLP